MECCVGMRVASRGVARPRARAAAAPDEAAVGPASSGGTRRSPRSVAASSASRWRGQRTDPQRNIGKAVGGHRIDRTGHTSQHRYVYWHFGSATTNTYRFSYRFSRELSPYLESALRGKHPPSAHRSVTSACGQMAICGQAHSHVYLLSSRVHSRCSLAHLMPLAVSAREPRRNAQLLELHLRWAEAHALGARGRAQDDGAPQCSNECTNGGYIKSEGKMTYPVSVTSKEHIMSTEYHVGLSAAGVW